MWGHLVRVRRESGWMARWEAPTICLASCLGSQNHRIVGVGRDLCGSSSPTLLLKQGHLQQAAQELVQAGLEYLQRRRLHHLPGQPVPVLCHPQREQVLPHVQTELPVPQFVPRDKVPITSSLLFLLPYRVKPSWGLVQLSNTSGAIYSITR